MTQNIILKTIEEYEIDLFKCSEHVSDGLKVMPRIYEGLQGPYNRAKFPVNNDAKHIPQVSQFFDILKIIKTFLATV